MEPVPGPLDSLVTLSLATSNDQPADIVRACPPTVNPARLLSPTPPLLRHRADVSDIQLDLSHADRPLDPPTVYDSSPSPAPLTVTLPDPVAAMFDLVVLLKGASCIETPPVRLPACSAAVAATRRVPPVDPPTLKHTAVSDSQSVLSEPVHPARA